MTTPKKFENVEEEAEVIEPPVVVEKERQEEAPPAQVVAAIETEDHNSQPFSKSSDKAPSMHKSEPTP